jgi:hypothetical protein
VYTHNLEGKKVAFDLPHSDTSYDVTVDNNGFLIKQYDYSSALIPVWRAADQASAEYFIQRFARTIDCWYDTYEVGTVWDFHMQHRQYGFDDTFIKTHVHFEFIGWTTEFDQSVLFVDFDEAVEAIR